MSPPPSGPKDDASPRKEKPRKRRRLSLLERLRRHPLPPPRKAKSKKRPRLPFGEQLRRDSVASFEKHLAIFGAKKTDEGRFVRKVPNRGHAIPFETPGMLTSLSLQAFLKHITFSFESILSLGRFADVVKSDFFRHSPPRQTLALSVELHIFHPDELPRAEELTEWVEVDSEHGCNQRAVYHLSAWMEAVEKLVQLPIKLDVRLCMEKPYRAYLTLRNETRVLRAENVTLEVILTESSWEKVPEKGFLMALTKFAITGKKMDDVYEKQRLGFTNEQNDMMFKYGTMVPRRMEILS
ncbi:hypothetical protein FSARC_13390 [Fusarium sarcochroum]|uniref:Uncharacterized protein n=1 Tax=Fusarium sarcochroum TaxID=1208366 RepID=A0A8H4WU02_9HYPO|nr:hypothetical protein FSARC_13390 [Fusarium sarcochroum]